MPDTETDPKIGAHQGKRLDGRDFLPLRGNPIPGEFVSNDSSGDSSGIEILADDGFPYTALGYINRQRFAQVVI